MSKDLQRTEMDFPVSTISDYTQYGMTLRDYFAVKAPEDIPWWFEGNYTALGDRPEPIFDEQDEENGNPFARSVNHDELVAWDLEASKLRYFQWRYAYAEGLLKAREA